MFPGAAFALGLGEIRNVSPLNQPLSAEIPVLSAAQDELDSLRAGIASREEFARLGKTAQVNRAVVELGRRIERRELEPVPANLALLRELAGV